MAESSKTSFTREVARAHLHSSILPVEGKANTPELFGMEVELFLFDWPKTIATGSTDFPKAVPLSASMSVVEREAQRNGLLAQRPGMPFVEGDAGRYTFEPGGQVEFSCAPEHSPRAAFETCEQALEGLQNALAPEGVRTFSMGANPWQKAQEVALQTDAGRYVCMDQHFKDIGPAGEVMMRRTTAAHINVDLGSGERARKRWLAAHLLSPLALATFAFSPLNGGRPGGAKSLRGGAWQKLDPSRTGFPPGLSGSGPSGLQTDAAPADQYLEFAMNASVMMIADADGGFRRPSKSLSFAEWIEHGADGCYPNESDWKTHLSTLFPEVRPKGFLELRSADAQAAPFRCLPLVWWVSLVCDDTNLDRIVGEFDSGKSASFADLMTLRERASLLALDDAELKRLCAQVFGWAREGMERCSSDHIDSKMRAAFQVFGDRFTLRGKTPADEVLERTAAAGGVFGAAEWESLEADWTQACAAVSAHAT